MGLRKGPMVAAAILALTAGILLAPAIALAQRSNGGSGRGIGSSAMSRQQWSGRGGHGHHGGHGHRGHGHHVGHGHHFKGHHHHFFRPWVPFAFAAPSVVYAAPYAYAPPAYYEPPAYYPAPSYYTAPTYYSPPRVSVAPMETVVQYSHGRYELRGDGFSTPYRWVWIPNAPPPPAAAPPPPAEPPASPSNGSNGSHGPAPARQTQLYRWTDAAGVVHWTDRLDAVPEQYRAQARQPRPS